MVITQAVRDSNFESSKEFIPVSLRDRADLRKAKEANPVFWIWDSGKIKRLKLGLTSTSDLLNKREPPLRGLTNLRSIE